MTRENNGRLPFFNDFCFAISRKHHAFASARGLARLDTVNSIFAKQIVGRAQQRMKLFAGAIKGDFTLSLRDIKAETGLVHRVAGESGEINRARIWHRPLLLIKTSRISKSRPKIGRASCRERVYD